MNKDNIYLFTGSVMRWTVVAVAGKLHYVGGCLLVQGKLQTDAWRLRKIQEQGRACAKVLGGRELVE